jgi:hypothetical protein
MVLKFANPPPKKTTGLIILKVDKEQLPSKSDEYVEIVFYFSHSNLHFY